MISLNATLLVKGALMRSIGLAPQFEGAPMIGPPINEIHR
jgi:hypothetical protein